MTSHFELSIMIGTREISGSPAIRLQKADHRRLAVEHRLVHVDVDDLRAVFDLLAGDAERLLELVVQDQARERLRPGDVGALADVDEQRVAVDGDRLEAGQFHRRHAAVSGRAKRRVLRKGMASDMAAQSGDRPRNSPRPGLVG